MPDRSLDANHGEIVAGLKAVSADVISTDHVGIPGFPDLLVGWRRRNFLIEIKTKDGKLQPDQVKLHEAWRGQIAVARTIEEAIDIMQVATLNAPIDSYLSREQQHTLARALATVREGGGYGTVSIELAKGVISTMATTVSEQVRGR